MSKNNATADVTLHSLPDYIKDNLDIVVVGLNPSLTSAQIGHYFAGPGNHFWSCVSEVGLVSEPVTCYDDSRMLDYGIGFTNACSRATKGAADLTKKEMKDGMKLMLAKLQKYSPKIVVFNGKGTYEIFVRHKHFGMGKQPQRLEGTNSVVFVMPSSSARCAQLPRAADKIPFFTALKDLRDKIKVWSNGLSTGDRLVPLEDMVNGSVFPDHVDLELTRLYDAGKSNYSTDRAEKKRKANASSEVSPVNRKTSSSEDSSQGSTKGIKVAQQLSKTNNYQRQKEDPVSSQAGPHVLLPNQTCTNANGQWVAGSFYNSSFSYQQYLLESSSQYPSQNLCRYPPFRSNVLPNGLPASRMKNYSNSSFMRHNFNNAEERPENSFDNSPSSDNLYENAPFGQDSSNKIEDIIQRNDAKETYIAHPARTNFVSLLMSDSLSVPGSPCECDKAAESRYSQSSMNWPSDNCPPYPLQVTQGNSFWEHDNNYLVNAYSGPRRPPYQQHQQPHKPMTSVFSNFQSNMGNFEEIPTDTRYQSPFTGSAFFASPTSIVVSGEPQIRSIHSPLSSNQVTSSLCSVKVAPDSTSLAANQKRPFSGPDQTSIARKIFATEDMVSLNSDHVSLTYTDL